MMDKDYYIEVEDEAEEIVEEETNPIENKHKKEKPFFSKSEKKKIKFWLIILVITLIFIFSELIIYYLQELLRANPSVHKFYLGVESEIRSNSLNGLLYVAILGSLFFLALPGEALFIYYLSKTTFFFPIVILIVVLGNTLGLIINYLIGRLFGEKLIKKMFEKSYNKYESRIDKWGGLVLFFGNIIPGPIELLTIFYGSFKYSFTKYVYISFMGRLFKYIILFLLFYFFWDQITMFYIDLKIKGFSFWHNLF